MSNKADWLIAREMEDIAAIMRALEASRSELVCIDVVPIVDANGEPLGFIEVVDDGVHFVPAKWREDD